MLAAIKGTMATQPLELNYILLFLTSMCQTINESISIIPKSKTTFILSYI